MSGTDTAKFERIVSLTEIRSQGNATSEEIQKLHRRLSSVETQLDRIETAIGSGAEKYKAEIGLLRAEIQKLEKALARYNKILEKREAREATALEAKKDFLGRVAGALPGGPTLWAAITAGGLGMGGDQLCTHIKVQVDDPPAKTEAP